MTRWVVGIALAMGGYAAGRFSGPVKETYKKQYDVAIAENLELKKQVSESSERLRNVQRAKVTTITENKDGTKTTRIRDVARIMSSTSKARTEAIQQTETKTVTDKSVEEKTIIHRSPAVGSLLIGVDPFDLSKGFDAGASFQAPAFGPTWFGVWGLFRHDIKGGISLGIGL